MLVLNNITVLFVRLICVIIALISFTRLAVMIMVMILNAIYLAMDIIDKLMETLLLVHQNAQLAILQQIVFHAYPAPTH